MENSALEKKYIFQSEKKKKELKEKLFNDDQIDYGDHARPIFCCYDFDLSSLSVNVCDLYPFPFRAFFVHAPPGVA
jgi:hypothetical protein